MKKAMSEGIPRRLLLKFPIIAHEALHTQQTFCIAASIQTFTMSEGLPQLPNTFSAKEITLSLLALEIYKLFQNPQDAMMAKSFLGIGMESTCLHMRDCNIQYEI